MTFHGFADQGGKQTHAGNSVYALTTMVSTSTDDLRKSYHRSVEATSATLTGLATTAANMCQPQ